MKYRAVRPYRGREGDVKAGQLVEMDEKRAAELGRLVERVEDDAQGGAKAEPPHQNKADDVPSNKAVTVEGTGAVRRPGRPKKNAE